MQQRIIYHNHHIVPRHMGGTDDPSNIARLTLEEHISAHKLLYEKHGKIEDRLAWQGLAGMIDRAEIIHQLLVENGRRSGLKCKGKRLSDERKNRLRLVNLGKRQSEETRDKKRKTLPKRSVQFGDRIREVRKSTDNCRKGVIAYGIQYRSIRAAAVAIGYSHSSVRMYCLDVNNTDFLFT